MTDRSTQEIRDAEEDARPVIVPVADAKGVTLFIGNLPGALSADLLHRHGITTTLNVALNIDPAPLTLADGIEVRRQKVGLIDGAGNSPAHLLSAVLAMAGSLDQASPGKENYPPHRRGNVLVHCRGGRSRSATVIAAYLHLSDRDRFPDFDAVIADIRKRRNLGPDQPNDAMLKLGRDAITLGTGLTL